MRLRSRQRGLGWFGLLMVLGMVGFVAIVFVKTMPLYLNQMKVSSALNKISSNSEQARSEGNLLRGHMAAYWNIDSIKQPEINDIKIKRTERGRFMVYDYEAKENLFYNIYIVIHFKGEVPLANVQ